MSKYSYDQEINPYRVLNQNISSPSRDLESSERWFLVHAQPRGEAKAQYHLRAQGFNTYLPYIRKTIRHARKLQNIRAPLFMRYLFVSLDLTRDPWLRIRSTIGVSSLYMCDEQPVPVPEGVVEALIATSEVDECVRLDDGIAPGMAVEVLAGPFAPIVGTLLRLDGRDRARVLIDMMGGLVRIDIPRSALAAVA